MNRRVPWMIGVDLSSTTRYLTYEDIIACEAIKEDIFKHEMSICEVQPHIVSRCNEEDEEDEYDDKRHRRKENDTI